MYLPVSLLYISPGEWEPIYIVKMPMATRELRQTPIVVQKNPITISVETTKMKTVVMWQHLLLDDKLCNPDSILIQGKVTFPDKQVDLFLY